LWDKGEVPHVPDDEESEHSGIYFPETKQAEENQSKKRQRSPETTKAKIKKAK